MFKVIIAGGREFKASPMELDKIDRLVSNHYDMMTEEGDLEMVTGCARGADQIPYYYNKRFNVPIMEFPADWDTHGKAAGFIRNRAMAEYADALIAFWDGESRGTKNMIEVAKELGLKVKVIRYVA
jgi:hypothetical protein